MRWLAFLLVLMVASASAQIPELPELPDTPLPPAPELPPIPSDPNAIVMTIQGAAEGAGLPPVPEGSDDPAAGPQEYQHVAWSDGDHAGLGQGYDLRSLWVWEADHETAGEGLMLRMVMDLGRIEGPDEHIVAVDIAVEDGDPVTIAFQSMDGGATWAGDAWVLDVNSTMGGELAPGAGAMQSTVLHALVPHASLAAAPGVNLTGFQAWSWTGAADGGAPIPADVAPGGYYVAGGAEVPEADGKLSSMAEEAPPYYLRGAGRHLDFVGEWSNGVVSMQVSNPYALDQTLRFEAPAGMAAQGEVEEVEGATVSLLPASGQRNVTYDAPLASQPQLLQWVIRSDVGGIATLQVELPALPPPPAPSGGGGGSAPQEPTPPIPVERTDKVLAPPKPPAPLMEDEPLEEDSPIGVWLVGAAILVAVGLRRRA